MPEQNYPNFQQQNQQNQQEQQQEQQNQYLQNLQQRLQQQNQQRINIFSFIPRDDGSRVMSIFSDPSVSILDEESVQISSDGDLSGQFHESDDGDYPDVDILPPLGPNSRGRWMSGEDQSAGEEDSDFPDVESLPPLNYSPPTRIQLLTQNDREDMRNHSKQRTIEDISRNFRCHRPQCENDENSISNPRLRRQQAYSGSENIILHCTKCGNPENYTLYY